MVPTRVTLVGGTGFIGTELAMRLAPRFSEVVLPTRRAARVREVRVLPNVRVVQADVHDPATLASLVAGAGVVVNLVGLLAEGSSDKASFAGAHTGLTGKIVDACVAAGVPRYLHVSALGADADGGSSEYLKSKGRAEDLVRAAPASLGWTIFRPSIVFGVRDSFFNRFATLLNVVPFVFPLAVPDARMAPVWVGDVCRVMEDSISDPSMRGSTVHLCGPEEFTLRELVEYAARAKGLKRRVIGLPDGLARLQGRIMERVPGKPFTTDNYLSLQTPSVCPDGAARQPTSIDAIVPRYLGDENAPARLQEWRAEARR